MGRARAVYLLIYFVWKEKYSEVVTHMDSPDMVNNLVGWSEDGKVGDQDARGRGTWIWLKE